MRNKKMMNLAAIIATGALMLGACSSSTSNSNDADGTKDANASSASTVEITDMRGEKVEVPVNPKKVVALDNRTFDTLADWGIKPVAVPKSVMPADNPFVKDDSITDIGDHKEPKLEAITAADPDLVIVGQRFGKYYDKVKEIAPSAAVIDLNLKLDEEGSGKALVDGLKKANTILGDIFEKKDEAKELNDKFDASIADLKEASKKLGDKTVMSLNVSGGNIGYIAPHVGRFFGPFFEIFDWKPALEHVEGESSDHKGDEVSVEAIAQANPDWLLVLDRDAAISDSDSKPARDVIDNSPALQNVTAVKEKHIYYAPNDTYTNESQQTITKVFEELAEALNS
ncbi:ABC transporter substrate-binding protein [Gleimia hominis]|uniref:ABC transporter substrate-binding protein n=1 Tax=Gleimia hominis TaxID=595468 RepID=A0ABU3IC79_9ACTO|nr:ABC transporter substrate-binding protein [Gleimia hominis]MDT3767077.1 ABC transporter substrate-binding protein [Gleimia hominis]